MSDSTNAETPLPTPANRPDADVVVFDGNCRICRAQIQRLARWDGGQRLAYLSLHDAEVARRWPDLSKSRLMEEMLVIDGQQNRHWGPYAVRYLSRRLPRLWWLALGTHLPGSMLIAKRLYRWIARNRYRLSGGPSCEDESCSLHL